MGEGDSAQSGRRRAGPRLLRPVVCARLRRMTVSGGARRKSPGADTFCGRKAPPPLLPDLESQDPGGIADRCESAGARKPRRPASSHPDPARSSREHPRSTFLRRFATAAGRTESLIPRRVPEDADGIAVKILDAYNRHAMTGLRSSLTLLLLPLLSSAQFYQPQGEPPRMWLPPALSYPSKITADLIENAERPAIARDAQGAIWIAWTSCRPRDGVVAGERGLDPGMDVAGRRGGRDLRSPIRRRTLD